MGKARILVVENEILIDRELEARLKGLGHTVLRIAVSGEEGLQAAAEARPDLVLKGGLDGISAAKEIRRRFEVPVVYVTACADEGTLEPAQVTGPYGDILKPFTEVPQILACIGQGQCIEDYQTLWVKKDGTRVAVCLTVSPIRNAAGEIIGAAMGGREVCPAKSSEEPARTQPSDR